MIQTLLFSFMFTMVVQSARAANLDEAIQSALKKNEMPGQAKERVVQAQEQYDVAKSNIYPSLYLNATHQVQPAPSDPIAKQFFPENQTTANLTLTQPLFRGLREFAALRQRSNLLNVQKQSQVNALLMLYEQVATSYLSVLSIEQDLKNLSVQKNIYAQRVKDLLARTRRGESSSTEALTAQSTEASLDAEIRIVQAQLKAARENFSFLTTLPADTPLVDMDASHHLTLRNLDQYLSRIDERPDIKSAKERLEASKEEVSVARGSHWPSLDAVGNYYLKRPDGYLSDIKWDVQLRFSMPIFEGGLRLSQTQEASSKYREGELELYKLRRQSESDIRSLHESLKMRVEQLAALKRSAELSEKNYQVVQRDYRRGLTRNIDVQLALTEYRVSRRGYDQARYQARLDMIRLESAAAILPASITKEL